MGESQRWVSVWGNAVSVAENRPERYAKDITIRYPVNIPFGGDALRLTFDNYCGTDEPFRQEMRHAYNAFIRTTDLIDGCIDFDKALEDSERPDYFKPEYDSGDHLHPSKAGYERMAAEIPAELLK